jgi:ribonuclease III
MVFRRALGAHRGRLLTALADWLTEALGAAPQDIALYQRALTHGSAGGDSYQRLEFLGDRVLGLTIARWLYAAYPHEPEGELSRRLNSLVTGLACAQVARQIGISAHLKLGKQARDDGAFDSDNILGDVTEALIGALYLDHGFESAEAFIRKHWTALVEGHVDAPRHPKSALQEWAAANNRRAPVYAITDRSGPHHAPRFTVTVSLGSAGEASATGASKQEAETAAASALLEQLK